MGDQQPDPAILSNVMPVDYLSGVVNNAILPGTLFYDLKGGGTGSLRCVANGYPSIQLTGTPAVSLSSNGTATFPYTDADKMLHPGDIISTNSSFSPYLSTPSYSTTVINPVIGQVHSATSTTVTLHFVPDYVVAQGIPSGTSLFLNYVSRAHRPGTGGHLYHYDPEPDSRRHERRIL